ncbi:MAG TPA: hypothetical protein VM487_15920 [Phycisphaerae bacterium]|nr:hypothetical protein [Phycisphaerae bacterium]
MATTGNSEKTWYERARFWVWIIGLLLITGVAWGTLRQDVCYNQTEIRMIKGQILSMDDDVNEIKENTAYMRGVMERQFGRD